MKFKPVILKSLRSVQSVDTEQTPLNPSDIRSTQHNNRQEGKPNENQTSLKDLSKRHDASQNNRFDIGSFGNLSQGQTQQAANFPGENSSKDKGQGLQKDTWIEYIFECLMSIESIKNSKRNAYFLLLQSSKLKIDSESLISNYATFSKISDNNLPNGGVSKPNSHQKTLKKKLKQIEKDREQIKSFMDELTTSDPDILCVVL